MTGNIRILLITHHFPPLNTAAALRPYAWAKYWSQAGHEVTVLTTKKKRIHGILNFSINGAPASFKIYEVEYGFKAKREARQLHKHLDAMIRYNNILLKVKNIYRRTLRFTGPLIESYYLWIPAAVGVAKILHASDPFDIIVSTYSPDACHWIAHHLKNKWHIPWVADFRDLWSGNHGYPGVWPFTICLRAIERIAVSNAELIMTVSEPLREQLAQRYKIPCITVENGFDPEEYEHLKEEKIFPRDNKLRFIYTGSFYSEKQDPSPFFVAIRNLIKTGMLSRESVQLYFYGSNLAGLIELARQAEVADIIYTPGHVPREQALRAQRDCSGLIFLEWNDVGIPGIMTGKIFEYMRSGRPVLVIGQAIEGSPGSLIKRAGVGFILGTQADEIQKFIYENFILKPEPIIRPDDEVIQNYSRKVLAQRALQYLVDLVAKYRERKA